MFIKCNKLEIAGGNYIDDGQIVINTDSISHVTCARHTRRIADTMDYINPVIVTLINGNTFLIKSSFEDFSNSLHSFILKKEHGETL